MYTVRSYDVNFKLLSVLSDGKIHSYKMLTSKLSCTSLSLFKAIRVASNLGIEIKQINSIGIYWNQPLGWVRINEKAVYSYLKEQRDLFNLTKFDLLDSTNNYLNRNKPFYLKYVSTPVIVSELQTKGRGTNNRSWLSNLGGSLTFSILWKFKHQIQHLSSLSLALGVCLIRVFKKLSLSNIYLKWPNDILYKKKKFAGILIECGTNEDDSIAAIIGIGVNFKLSSNLFSLVDYAVTDLFEISGKVFDRNQILALILIELRSVLSTFEIYGFCVFRDEWQRYHAYQGQSIELHIPYRSSVEGIVDGVREDGSLTLLTSSGKQYFNIGEISFRVKT